MLDYYARPDRHMEVLITDMCDRCQLNSRIDFHHDPSIFSNR